MPLVYSDCTCACSGEDPQHQFFNVHAPQSALVHAIVTPEEHGLELESEQRLLVHRQAHDELVHAQGSLSVSDDRNVDVYVVPFGCIALHGVKKTVDSPA